MDLTIGPNTWKVAAINNIKVAQAVVQRSDKFNELGKQLDPLPSLKDSCTQSTNNQIHAYVRSIRIVVSKLTDSLLGIEEDIKSLLRTKESLEKALENVRKDLILNQDSAELRKARPKREKSTDGADDCLAAEKIQFLKLKRVLEGELRSIQKQLQSLDSIRKRLKAVRQERNRVLDLACQTGSARNSQRNTLSDVTENRCEILSTPPRTPLGPLDPFSPESLKVIELANEAKDRSFTLKNQAMEAIKQTTAIQKEAYSTVNHCIRKKVAETITMKQHLQLTAGETRVAIHRGDRWHYATDIARNYTLGPVSSQDLTIRERLNRPVVKVYQRHPGTQLTDAQDIIQANHGLKESLDAIGRNIAVLNVSHQDIKKDIKDKGKGAKLDANVVRMRRRKSTHRWVIGET